MNMYRKSTPPPPPHNSMHKSRAFSVYFRGFPCALARFGLCLAVTLSLLFSAVTASAQDPPLPGTDTPAATNIAPIADAGAHQTVGEGVLITLNGSASSDPEGEALTYAWTQTSGADVTLSAATAVSPTFTAPINLTADATLTFSLTVTDARGLVSAAADTVTITVTAGDNDAPIADAGAHQTVGEGVLITLNGSASSDPEGEALTYAWTQTSGADVTLSAATAVSPTFTAPINLTADATLTFSLTVTDARGLVSAAADTVTITVTAGDNDAPTADAGAHQTVGEGVLITLNGSASSDPEGEALTYAWTQTDGTTVTLSAATAVSPTFTAPINLTADATLTFSLTVTDARGLVSAAADTVTITVTSDVSVQKTVESINRFMHTRTNLILANQPKLSRRINRLQRGVGSEQLSFATGEITKLKPFEFNFLSLGSGTYKFATSLDQVTRAADHLQVTKGGTAYHESRRFDVWFEGSLNKFNGSAGSNGDFAIAYLGADYLVSPDLLVGGLLQYDSLTSSAAKENTEGKGWMAGPYVTARLTDNLYLDARLAWGTSDNDISPEGANYTDSFKSTRRLANISLSGEFTQGDWTIRPNASLSYMADKQKAYTNTLGDTIQGQTVSSGQLRLGPNFSTQFLGDNGWVYEPSFTLDAIYSHANTSGGLGTTPSPQDGWRARLEAGLGMTLSETSRLSFTGNYDGIGQSGFEAWGLGVSLDMEF